MTFRRLIIAIAVTLSAGRVFAEDAAKLPSFDPAAYPPEVQKALHDANEECAAEGGGAVRFALDTVRKLDLTGDGRDDYILDFRDTQCADREGAYCGTGGCILDILVTLPNGRVRRVFDGYVRAYEIRPDPSEKPRAAHSIKFELHGGYCGGHGNPSCFKERTITTRPFAFTMPQ